MNSERRYALIELGHAVKSVGGLTDIEGLSAQELLRAQIWRLGAAEASSRICSHEALDLINEAEELVRRGNYADAAAFLYEAGDYYHESRGSSSPAASSSIPSAESNFSFLWLGVKMVVVLAFLLFSVTFFLT